MRHGLLDKADAARILRAVSALGLPSEMPPGLGASAMLDAMGLDKKVVDGKLRLVLARRIGEVVVTGEVEHQALSATLQAGCGR